MFIGLTVGFALILVEGSFQVVQAQTVSVSPTRVVFEGRERSAEISLRNHGNERVTYRLGLQRMRMDEDGVTTVIADDDGEAYGDERFADEYLRFSPRQVTLGPGEVQRVRVMARKPVDLEDGEYRAHLRFEALPTVSAPAKKAASGGEDFQIELRLITSLTIPVIIRHGDLAADLEISNLTIVEATTNTVAISLSRRGNRSVYGDIEVLYRPEGGQENVVALRKGVAVYAPNDLRRLYLPLDLPEGSSLDGGRITVRFKEEKNGPTRVAAGKAFAIPASNP